MGDQECPSLKQTHSFLVLQRAQRGHGFEVTVKGRNAHRSPLCQRFHAKANERDRLLLSEEGRWINAQTIEVAGGYNI